MARQNQLGAETARLRRRNRVRAKINGTSDHPRMVIFRSLKHMSVQLIDDVAGKTIVAIDDRSLKTGTPTERAEKVGSLIAEKAKAAKITTVVFDRREYKYHGRVKALAEAARKEGLLF